MNKCLVTGAAGFIGSHLVEKLVSNGFYVYGIDSFTNYYNQEQKKRNIEVYINQPNVAFYSADILSADLSLFAKDIDYCFHLAGEPGVRLSWGQTFQNYLHLNVLTTQKLLEFLKNISIKKFVYASSSSVYGICNLPMQEASLPKPISPYGVTKFAAEQICHTYWHNYQIPTVALRYFTVYGPRQRPDMAFSKMIRCLKEGELFYVYGDGRQTRDFTYVEDIVEATISAAKSDARGEVINIGGGSRANLLKIIEILQKISGGKLRFKHIEGQKGDPVDTLADLEKAKKYLNYKSKTSLEQGLRSQFQWFDDLLDT
ncbi:NAD dependent epimerase/dehydratase family protein [Desulfotomaculum arcticum]|uniref:NAD dependent epimerase/dehydratase family protein n=1 Tax=Desulfotruncus arcticus DSM 17038 TaxID=1121424 RepID=A0A1I2N6K2_9FIRM|nr:NAD-dependent epimerase/dehydratase family protein [Desulfotruncus arcticus]SFF98479.1 NAD dependent epimerase/dehydratase family protein [Desulfotomaculum arcticum] [Desulfotruncus arcticus DSM 17038]